MKAPGMWHFTKRAVNWHAGPPSLEYTNPKNFDMGGHFSISQCYNEHKFRSGGSWDPGNWVARKPEYGSKRAYFHNIKTGVFETFFKSTI